MSKTVSGRVQATSDKEDNDYFGICIDDDWFNGPGSLKKNLEEAEVKLTVKDNSESFIDIEEIDIIEEANEGGDSSQDSNASSGSGSSNTGQTSSNNNMSPRQEGITANSAVKLAVENAETDYTDDKAAHLDEVDEKSQAYSNMIQDRLREIQE